MPEDLLLQGLAPESEDQRRALLDFLVSQTSAVFFIAAREVDRPLRYITANVEAVTGHPASAFLEEPQFFFDHLHPDDRADYRRQRETLADQGATIQEYRFATATGAYRWFRNELKVGPADGQSTDCIGCMIDITAEKESQGKEMLEDAIEALSEGLILYDADDRMIMCNGRYKEFQGEGADLFVPGVKWQDVTRARAERGLFSSAVGRVEDWLEEELAQRLTAENEIFAFAGERWFEYSHLPTRQGGFVSTWRDITQRKTMEQALQEREQQFRSIVEGHPIPVWMIDMETGRILYESPAAAELVGREWPSSEPRTSLDHIADPAARDEVNALLRQHGEVRDYQCQYKKADGTLFWVSVNDRLIVSEGREVSITSFIDLTAQKQREAELRQAREVLEDAIESLPEGFSLFGADDRLVLCNSKFREFNDLSADVLEPGVRWHDFIRTGAERGQYSDAVGQVEAWLEERFRYHSLGVGDKRGVEFQQHDGRWFYAFSQLTRQGGYVGIRIDITEQKRAQEELVRQREMLHQSEKLSALGELLAGISHELNNPLSVLVGQALMLREQGADEKTAARAEKISEAADRCARIVRTFLALARQGPAETVPVDLKAQLDKAMEMTAYALRTSDVEVTTDIEPGLPMTMADPDQIQQVFTNLILNAQQALQDVEGRRRLKITLGHRDQGSRVVIKFKDNGPGIPEQIRSRIFEPLYSTKEVGSGTGIGLALCHRIVEAHGGTITLESGLGQGAAFAIRLPRAEVEPAPEAAPAPATERPSTYRVLVVDDEYDVGQIISDVLQHQGHVVEVANSGALALEKIKDQVYDVVLSDIRMPEMDGPTFYRHLQELKPEQIEALAFITGDTLSPWVKQFLDESKRPFVEKPILPRDIRALVERLVAGKG